jgi:hypothetical protein
LDASGAAAAPRYLLLNLAAWSQRLPMFAASLSVAGDTPAARAASLTAVRLYLAVTTGLLGAYSFFVHVACNTSTVCVVAR